MADSWPTPKPAVLTTIRVIRTVLPGVYVKSIRPTDRPEQYVTVGLMNSSYPNPAFTVPRPLIEIWGSKTEAVEELSNVIVAGLRNAKGKTFADAFVLGCSNIQGPVEYNDPDITDRLRWQVHFDLYLSTL